MRKLIAALVVLFAVVSWVMVVNVRNPASSLGGWGTDHFSHYGAAILFVHRGFDIYREPIEKICPPGQDPDALAFATKNGLKPVDVCNIPERAGQRPLVINWSQYPRPYPPGVLLYSAPEALLYEHTHLSFMAINRLSILKYLFTTCLLLGLLIYALVFRRPPDAFSVIVILPLLASDAFRFAFWGFYDGIGILCACASIYFFSKRAHHKVMAFYAVALLFHFRAIWLLPLIGFSLVSWAREGWRRQGKQLWFILGSSVPLLLSTYTFWLCLPFFRDFPRTNPIYLSSWSWENPSLQALALPVGLSVGLLLWERNWVTGVVVLWQLALVANTPQAQAWHSGFFIPIVVLAGLQGQSVLSAMAAISIYLAEAQFVFRSPPSLDWLVQLFVRT